MISILLFFIILFYVIPTILCFMLSFSIDVFEYIFRESEEGNFELKMSGAILSTFPVLNFFIIYFIIEDFFQTMKVCKEKELSIKKYLQLRYPSRKTCLKFFTIKNIIVFLLSIIYISFFIIFAIMLVFYLTS